MEIVAKALTNPATSDADNVKKVSSLCGIEARVKELHAHTNVVYAQNAGCGIVWNLAAGSAEFKLQTRHHGGVDTVLHAMEDRRLVSTETQVVDVKSKAGRRRRSRSRAIMQVSTRQNDFAQMTDDDGAEETADSSRPCSELSLAFYFNEGEAAPRTKMTRELKTSTDLDTNDC